MKKPPSYVRRVKKLNVKPGDIVVATLKGFPLPRLVADIRDEFESMPFMKGVFLIVATEQVHIKKARPKDGKHQVFLDNLEYLEYLAKHKKGD